jgi:hypothetical protein
MQPISKFHISLITNDFSTILVAKFSLFKFSTVQKSHQINQKFPFSGENITPFSQNFGQRTSQLYTCKSKFQSSNNYKTNSETFPTCHKTYRNSNPSKALTNFMLKQFTTLAHR